ncbi:MAG: cyclic nucleotide-binding domain-containing protein, partial [Candidatus Competibacteraceae bacterium]|nr:cyclic nucleotide-binding domain-containing protein [Candidatus Competibacteraceae bacterium]
MTCLDRLLDLPLWADIPPAILHSLRAEATVVRLKQGDYLARQHHPARDFHLLVEGRVEFLIQVDDSGQRLSVGIVQRPLTPMGWSGLRPPHRFAADIRCLTSCTLIRWPQHRLVELLDGDPVFGLRFLELILATGGELLHQARKLLEQCARSPWDRGAALNHEGQADHHPGLLERL